MTSVDKYTSNRSRMLILRLSSVNKRYSLNSGKGLMCNRKIVVLFACTFFAGISSATNSEIPIPRSVAGDKGSYFLLEKRTNKNIVRALHKRVGVDSVGYTITETNCTTMQMRELGYSEQSPSAIKEKPTKWFDLIPGSSKSDLASFVCR